MKFIISLTKKINAIRNNRWAKLTLFIILMSGMAWQVYQINMLYLRFDTVVDINVERQFHIQLPSFTICMDLDLDALDPLKEIYPDKQLSNNLTSDEKRKLYRSAPIDLLFKYAVIQSDLTINCLLICSQNSRFTNGSCVDVPCQDYSPVRKTIAWARNSALRRCDTYFHWNDPSRSNSGEPFMEESNGERDLINFNITKASNEQASVIFSMHDGSLVPWTEDQDFSSLHVGLMSIVSVNYQLTRIMLLEPPYKTNCRKYPKLSGWVGCMYDCKEELNRKDSNGWPLDVPAESNVSIPFVPESRQLGDPHLTHKINRECRRECDREQCTLNEYSHYLKYIQYNLTGDPNIDPSQSSYLTRVYIHRPFNFDVVYKHRPAIEFIEYFSYVGSAIGLWFGFSCLTFFNFAEKFFKQLISGKKVPEKAPKTLMKKQGNTNETSTNTPKRIKKRPPNITLTPPRTNNMILPISTNLSPTYKSFNQSPDDVVRFNGPLTS
uniref:Uncharacterized protein n=1 Tax=Tetranychus urticae TaxID=32264 RepID=T1K8D8_TETUR